MPRDWGWGLQGHHQISRAISAAWPRAGGPCCSEPWQSSCPSVSANACARGGEAELLPEPDDGRTMPWARHGLLGLLTGRTLAPVRLQAQEALCATGGRQQGCLMTFGHCPHSHLCSRRLGSLCKLL